jgi:hypothetical protein
MRQRFIFFSIIICFLFIHTYSYSQTPTRLQRKLEFFKEISDIKPVQADSSFSEAYEFMFEQPVDHKNPDGPKFKQKIILSYKNEDAPVVLITEGYSAGRNYKSELASVLDANQIIVEHRYFGKSVPEGKDWQYLNIKQAADDHHAITTLFKNIFRGKWISTGISKGGQTTLFYKRFYPDDVDVAVPYVAPVNLAQEDPRIYTFLSSVGTEKCREKILAFQREFLLRRDEIMPMMIKEIADKNLHMAFDNDFLYDYMTLEYQFSFWQWGTKCEDIPEQDAPAEQLYKHMIAVSGFYFFTKEAMEEFGSFYVQAYNEIGYYGYDTFPFKDLLKEIKNFSNAFLVPKDAKINFNPNVMKDVNDWLRKSGNNILYIYGGNDAWSSTSIKLTEETNAVKMVKEGGSHGTRILDFGNEQKELIYSTLEKWLGVIIDRK